MSITVNLKIRVKKRKIVQFMFEASIHDGIVQSNYYIIPWNRKKNVTVKMLYDVTKEGKFMNFI